MTIFSRLAAILLLVSAPALAQQTPLAVGDAIPESFAAKDSLGRAANFESLKGDNGLILLFTRSADWCQYCKAQLQNWNAKSADVAKAGYGLAAISYDAPSVLAGFEKANDLKYTLLSDEGSAMIKAFGIRNEKFAQGSRFYGIPNPAIYVFNSEGEITHIFSEEGYKQRPTVDSVLSAVAPAEAEAEAETEEAAEAEAAEESEAPAAE